MLALKLQELEIASKYIKKPRIKTVALLRAVEHKGRTFLQSVGCSYEKAFALLDDYYGREENFFVKTVLVSQLAGENDNDYLSRVERLSRDAGFDDANALRKRYCFVIAN